MDAQLQHSVLDRELAYIVALRLIHLLAPELKPATLKEA
jgi:hypothetical protein